jgi:hypothetical protein
LKSLDFGRVEFLTGNALGQLISLHKKVRAGGGRLILSNVSPEVFEVFETTRLHAVMDILEGPENRVYGQRELVVRDCNGLVLAFGEETSQRAT